ncbi:MAG: tetratricopeptide repeat protein [Bacteroidales bacterium]|nr:tetratricopeptide repeat protein [Bacteroidales bacterium]
MKKLKLFSLSLLILIGNYAFSQNAKSLLKTGKDFIKAGNYEEAINQFSKAIELEPQFIKAFYERAETYLKINKKAEAAKDYENIGIISPKKQDAFSISGRLFYELEEYEKAVIQLNKATELSKKDIAAYKYKVLSYIELKKYLDALKESNILVNLASTSDNFFYHGWINQMLKSYALAEADYLEAIKIESTNLKALVQLAYVRMYNNKLDLALEAANDAIKINNKSKYAYIVRSLIFKKNLDYPSAINDLSKITLLYPDDVDGFFNRGIAYQDFNQHQNAINDFTKVLNIENNYIKALTLRAKSYEQINDYNNAVKDYEKICSLDKSDKETEKLLVNAQQRVYELNREEKSPTLSIIEPLQKETNTIEVAGKSKILKIQLKVVDDSPILKLVIEGKEIKFDKDSIKLGFIANVDVEGKKKISIEAEDIYNNRGIFVYTLIRTETNNPDIQMLSPFASDNGEIYLDSNDPNLYIEGLIEDESLIKSITVDDVNASFKPDESNPKFNATVIITNKDKITITVKDIYENTSIKEYKFNRSGIEMLADNPMGKTWVVFIENSDYVSFTSLKGPSKDVTLMKGALSKYKIHNILHKRNLTKKQMERFFAIELRDLVKSNHVNSILVWYAGHGKFINETGYWIPVDAQRDDEFSYYNINSLKASMQSYSKYITHTLLVTDACESGPTFYMAMRSIPKERDCNDANATKFKSSQVFSSAGYELAADKSQFTQTFANTLNFNSNSCVPIERVVIKVSSVVKQNSKQTPKFGKISGFEDENGTFFFIKK